MWHRIQQVLRSLLSRQRVEAELDEELRDHLERDIAWRKSRGLDDGEARRAALAAFGGVERFREEVRDVRGITPVEDAVRDVRFACRRIARSTRYAALVVTTIALGIGAAATILAAVDGVLLKPLPYTAVDRLVTIWQTKQAAGLDRDDVSVGNFLEWKARARAFTGLVAGNPWSVNLRGEGMTENVEAWTVTPGFFELVGAHPLLGRSFRQEDYAAAEAQARRQGEAGRSSGVVILEHGFWQRRFGGDPAIIGRTLMLDGAMHTVIGVMPRGFRLPEPTNLWLPNVFSEEQLRDHYATYIKVFGRLRANATLAGAQLEMDEIARQLAREHPRANGGVGARVIGLAEILLGGHRTLLWVLLGAVGLLLLITLANVAALHITRLGRQRRELAVRAALGARGRDLRRPVIAEAFLLSILGGVGGTVLSFAGVQALRILGPSELPRLDEIAVDGRVLLAVLALVVVNTVIMSTVGRRNDGIPAVGGLGQARSVIGHHSTLRVRRSAVGAQLALALVLLIGTSLLVRSFLILLSTDRGYHTANILSFTSWLYDEYPEREALVSFVNRVRERIAAVPGVRSVAVASALPLADDITGELADIVVEGAAIVEGQEPQARATLASPQYFPTLGIRLVKGRLIDDRDDARSRPVVLVNEAFANRFFDGLDPVGRTVAVGLMGRASPREVVGVVGNTRHARLDQPPDAAVFIPWAQRPIAAVTFVIGTTVDPSTLAQPVARALFEIDPHVGIARVSSMDALLEQQLRERTFLILLLGGFAVVAITVAVVGVYGVMSQSIAEREREIGLRMALGASARSVTGRFVGEAGWIAAAGLVAGLLVTLVASRALTSFLYGVAPLDPLSLIIACGLVGGLAVAAALIPSWRAARVPPSQVLQES
jgi:putative ABC transport system permease protein